MSFNLDIKLGFACVIEGDKRLRASDNRKPKNSPHLKYSIQNFFKVLDYLNKIDVSVFRLPSNFIPYATHPDYPEFDWKKQLREAKFELAELRTRLKEQPVRLSFHPSQFVLLNSPTTQVINNSIKELEWQSTILDKLECSAEARVLLHVGGAYDNRQAALERLYDNIENKLSASVLQRLAFENDDRIWSAREVVQICRDTGLPMIFDLHHHACLNTGEDWRQILQEAIHTWPEGVRPKIHLSSPRLQTSRNNLNLRAHSDYIDPFLYSRFLSACAEKRINHFDIMLEAKRKDLALLALRSSDYPKQILP